jgi:hypothetical protein
LFSGVAVVSEHAVLQISHKVTAGDEIERMWSPGTFTAKMSKKAIFCTTTCQTVFQEITAGFATLSQAYGAH